MSNRTRRCKPKKVPSSPSMGWTHHTLKYYAEFNPTRKKFWTRILCALRFKTVWEIIQCCFTSMGLKRFVPAVLLILYNAKILREEIMQNLLYMQWYVKTFTWNLCNPYVYYSWKYVRYLLHSLTRWKKKHFVSVWILKNITLMYIAGQLFLRCKVYF